MWRPIAIALTLVMVMAASVPGFAQDVRPAAATSNETPQPTRDKKDAPDNAAAAGQPAGAQDRAAKRQTAPRKRPVSRDIANTNRSEATAGDRRLDLFPSAVLHRAATGDAGEDERRQGTCAGLDGSWKAHHAAQVGIAVGVFGVLAALCGSGKCAIPDSWTSWLPGSLSRDSRRPQ